MFDPSRALCAHCWGLPLNAVFASWIMGRAASPRRSHRGIVPFPIPKAKRITRINEWRQLIYKRQQSRQSIRIWCQQNGIRENSYYYWLRIIREEALCEAKNRNGALVRVEPEKLAVEAASLQSCSGGIVVRAHGVEAEFPSGTDIGTLAAFVKALGHA